MTRQHVKWTSSIEQGLHQIRLLVDGGGLQEGMIDSVGDSIQQHGFALLRGIGSDGNLSQEVIADQLFQLSSGLGKVVPQSPRKEWVESVRDYSDVDERDDRGYRSRGELTPHSDPTTLIVLHCLQPAKSGGESYLVNVRAIHDAMEDDRPDLLEVLYQGFPFWRVEGRAGGPGPAPNPRPIFTKRDDQVSCVYYRPFAEKAAEAMGQPLSEKQVAALDLFDHYSNAPELALRLTLAPTETLILHNRTVLHARTDYEDFPEQEKRRHLLRLWIDAPELLPVDPVHELGDLFPDIDNNH